jgi:hypothetical protein
MSYWIRLLNKGGKNYYLFEKQDYHLNGKGHRLVADAVFDQI